MYLLEKNAQYISFTVYWVSSDKVFFIIFYLGVSENTGYLIVYFHFPYI